MKNRLFWRLFIGFTTALLITVALFTGILAGAMKNINQSSYESEVLGQAREVAEYLTYMNQLSLLRENSIVSAMLTDKIAYIRDVYNADIWIASYSTSTVQMMDGNLNTSDGFYNDAVYKQLDTIKSGSEIRVRGLFPELGDDIITIGVPWTYSDGRVVGAVLLHISVDYLMVDYFGLVMDILPAACLVFILGTIMAYILARSQIDPVRKINDAVRDFSKGQLDRRVKLHCGGELQELGDSIDRMAEELSKLEESRRSFVANVSHELRSPLTCMRGYVQGMLDGTISGDDLPKYLQVVMDETQRLTELVRDLLDLSRFESGKFPLEISVVDINELIRRVIITFGQRIDAKGIEVNVYFDDNARYVSADANRINQVVSNLVDNAVKFMQDSGGVLEVGTSRSGKLVKIWVSDNGCGISQEDLPYVFDRFYKADKAHTSGMGTGLGLSIVQRIIEQHGSTINVASGSGHTIFEFSLPAVDTTETNKLDGVSN